MQCINYFTENGECRNDYVEFQEIDADSNSIRNERRFCSSQQPGYIYSTSSKAARRVFKSDSTYQRRGFWLRYSGMDRQTLMAFFV